MRLLGITLAMVLHGCGNSTISQQEEGLAAAAFEDPVVEDETFVISNASLVATPNPLDFGTLATGASATSTITFTNSSNLSLQIGALSGFSTSFQNVASTCEGTLISQQTCTVEVKFTAGGSGSYLSNIIIQYGTTEGSATEFQASAEVRGTSGLLAPSNITFSNPGATSINLSWQDNSINEDKFEIQACQGSSCTSNFVASTTAEVSSNISTYLFSSLDEGKYYTFRVRSASSTEASDWLTSSKVLMFGPATVSDVGNGGIDISGFPCTDDHLGKTYATINFTAASEASRFDIYRVSFSEMFSENEEKRDRFQYISM